MASLWYHRAMPLPGSRPASVRWWWLLAAVGAVVLAGCGPRRPLPADGVYRLDLTSPSTEPSLANVGVTALRLAVEPDGLRLRLAFVNRGGQRFGVEGPSQIERATLVDSTGRGYRPRSVSANLSVVSPPDGFAPGAANVGEVAWPRPRSGGPYTLRVPGFIPLLLEPRTLYRSAAALPSGQFRLDVPLASRSSALAMVELRVRGVRIGADVRLDVAFCNITRSGWALNEGPSGADARLLDAEGTAFAPLSVGSTLRASIAPPGGWKPGQENGGELAFPRPAMPGPWRLVFPHFDALLLETDGQGIEAGAVTVSGGESGPAPRTDREDAVYTQLLRLLQRQARALLAPDPAAYSATFAGRLREGQKRFATRVANLPLESYSLEPSPDADLKPGAGGKLKGVSVVVRYRLRGVPPDNEFVNSLRYDFEPASGGAGAEWLVCGVDADRNAPFWQLGPVEVRDTQHFLLLTRPASPATRATLASETEAAYARLQALGLPLAERYVGHVTATQAEFGSLAGRDSSTAGVATWRYDIASDRVKVYSRTFYLNGAALSRSGAVPGERRTTIVHELVHLALADDTRPVTPPWVTEGMAVHFSGETTAEARRQLVVSGLDRVNLKMLTRSERLGLPRSGLPDDPRQARFEYDYAGLAIGYLMSAVGREAVLAFYRAFRELPVDAEGKTPDRRADATEQVLKAHFGRDLATLDSEVKQWLRQGGGD
ncbi:MAG: hypothetical protein HZB16_08130 [Armatimonadetes bacterium]|nr:hypothetical protein [Armatimonadota bacterium]